MGREVKRVALNFKWELNKVWEGFLDPHHRQCAACEGSGQTTARLRLEELIRLILLSGEDTIRERGAIPHPYFSQMQSLHRTYGKVVSKDMLELTNGLSGRDVRDSLFGYDSTAAWSATKKIIAAAGLTEETWGLCPICEGHGDDPETRAASEAWESQEPPSGEGWQMWETTSEGSPISPVFETPEALAQWLADTGASTFGRDTAGYDTWLQMITGSGWAMSAVMDEKGFRSGVDAVADMNPRSC